MDDERYRRRRYLPWAKISHHSVLAPKNEKLICSITNQSIIEIIYYNSLTGKQLTQVPTNNESTTY
jgi:hypothetical protein